MSADFKPVVALILVLQACHVLRMTVSQTVTTDVCANARCALKQSACKPDNNGSYICSCFAGYQGDDCGEDLDECSRGQPCRNRGHCVNAIGSYTCTCLPGWEGDHCTTPDGTNRSECLPGWKGNRCHEDIDECTNSPPSPCENGATCQNNRGSYYCQCAAGWEGFACNIDRNECEENNQCQNGAACSNVMGSYVCLCLWPWTGHNCDVKTNTTKPFVAPLKLPSSEGSSNIVLIAGASVGGVLVVAGVVAAIVAYTCFKKPRQVGSQPNTVITMEQTTSSDGAADTGKEKRKDVVTNTKVSLTTTHTKN